MLRRPVRFLSLAATATLAACTPSATPGASAQTPPQVPPQVDSVRLLADLTVLAHDSMEGRGAGTAGNLRARRFLERRLEELPCD